ncbi:hypothetical protein HPP92_005405 [Vanilla planifolia]|uniref:Growth-regulating factor n=1 Tax=Vanilla planifolia TaxID=51239 RepID=A0A835VFC9_VANPL|nr:hypothetical protein HPP92_005405 [Vanilla planifolia]
MLQGGIPDSKYCEKHMHRGKNRSRKPEEISFATTSNRSSSSSSNQRSFPANLSISTPDAHHLSYPSPTSSRHPGTSLSFDKGIGQLHLSSGSPSVRDHRRSQEMKGFHAESYENEWGSSCQFGAAVRAEQPGRSETEQLLTLQGGRGREAEASATFLRRMAAEEEGSMDDRRQRGEQLMYQNPAVHLLPEMKKEWNLEPEKGSRHGMFCFHLFEFHH